MLDCAFNDGMTEHNYHNVVKCLKNYVKNPDPRTIEVYALHQKNWPLTYHPCDHMENIRWGTFFLREGQENENLVKMIYNYTTLQ